jgi:hypothetical protein
MWRSELVDELQKAERSGKNVVIEKYRVKTGYSRQQLYRIASQCGYQTDRKKRSDKGSLATGLAEGQIEYVAAIIESTARQNKGPIMPVEMALEIALDNRIIERGQVSVATMQRLLREREMAKMHLKEATPHTEMRSLHPNHCHLVDVSVCIQYYLKGGKLRIMREDEFYKNKLGNLAKIKTRLLRYLVVDHFSGAFYLKYYDATGETRENLYNFLVEAWRKKEDVRFPFRGVPFFMLMDAGSANISKAMTNFFKHMDIRTPEGMPKNPRRQGAVESMHRVIEEWFESRLRIDPANTVEEINDRAMDFMIWFQGDPARVHSRHGMTRTNCWLLIKSDQLRELPADDILQDLFANPEETRRVDGSLYVSFRGKSYRLKHIQGIRPRAEVKVVLKPYSWPVVEVVYRDQVYEASPTTILPPALGGFKANAAIIGEEYRALPETETQRAVKRMENIAYGEDRKKNSIPFAGTHVFGGYADKLGDVTPISRVGRPIEISRPRGPLMVPIMKLFRELAADGLMTVELNQSLSAEFGETIEAGQIQTVVEMIRETGTFIRPGAGQVREAL